jgi:hypothetical protein
VDRPVPYLLFVEPFTGAGAGWPERVRTLDSAYGTLREELHKRGTSVDEPPAPAAAGAPHVAFGARLSQWITSTEAALSGAVAILAPNQVDAPDRFCDELAALVSASRLSAARWVVVLPAGEWLEPLVKQLGRAVLVSDCVVPPEESAVDLEKMMSNAGAAGPGAAPLARAGMAWPAQRPPARKHAGGAPVPEAQPSPEDAARLAVRTSLLQSAIATRAGKGLDAVRTLRAAYDASVGGGLVDERLAIHLMLATSVAGLGERKRAIEELELVQAEGMELERPLATAQAAQAKAALQAGAREIREAIGTYAEALAAARMAGNLARPILIDMLRAAGQLCVEAGMERQATTYWREAIALAEEGPPEVPAGGAVEAARALAKLCRKRGLRDQAASLEAQADRLDAAPVPGAEAN